MSVDLESGAEEAKSKGEVNPADLFYSPELASEQPEDEIETADEDDAEVEEPDDGSPDADGETFDVKVDGEEVHVTIDQLKDGYAGTAAIQKGLRENADERKRLSAERKSLSEDSELLLNDDLDFLEKDELSELKHLMPDLYVRIVDRTKSKADRLKELQKSQEGDAEIDAEEAQRELLSIIPEWNNEAKAKDEGAITGKFMLDMGYTEDEVRAVVAIDPKVVGMARKAALYDKIMSAKPNAKAVRKKPKSNKPGASTEKADAKSFADRFYSN